MKIENVGIAGVSEPSINIAVAVASAGYGVSIWDNTQKSLDSGKKALNALFDKVLESGTLTKEKKDGVLVRITFGKDMATMSPGEPLWPSSSKNSKGLTSGTFYGNLQRYFRSAGITPSGVHIFRHTAAKLRRDAGETVEDVSRFLDHSSLAVTTVYLRRLEGEQDRSWTKVAQAIGV